MQLLADIGTALQEAGEAELAKILLRLAQSPAIGLDPPRSP